MSEQHIRAIQVSAIELETLRFLHNKGPIWDGNLPSKSARDTLVEKGLAIRMIHQGQGGHQACTDRGRGLLRAFQEEIEGVEFK